MRSSARRPVFAVLAFVQARRRSEDRRARGARRPARLVGHVESVFGEMKGDYGDFANCGARRRRSADGAVTLDQDEYIDALMPIRHVDLGKAKADELAGGQLPDLSVALLGAAACALLCQHRVAAYIVALQRAKNKRLILRAKQLDSVVLATQKIKARITFPAMECAG